jgi:hypothetical protein
MVRRISGKPVIQFHFSSDGSTVECRLSVKLKRLDLKSGGIVFLPTLWDGEVVSRLAELGPKFAPSRQAILDARHKKDQLFTEIIQIQAEMGGRTEVAGFLERRQNLPRLRKARSVAQLEELAVMDKARAVRLELEGIQKRMAEPQFVRELLNANVPLEGSEDGREYALCQGILWSCTHKLEPQQWQALINRELAREAAKLAVALGSDTTSSSRERISPEVRRAVWIRDGGCCARCRSRERLEYDHIIPVSRGGGNSERNIELLCEVHNRSKSDSI